MKKILLSLILILSATFLLGQDLTATQIVQRSNDKLMGNSSFAELKMAIMRPTWTREVSMKSWSKGDDLALLLVTSPARDKGTSFLMRGNELWNWQPTIDRIIKMPPSMMMQSWMGSDFTNDDLVKQSSIVDDYTHELLGEESIDNYVCHIVELIPTEEAAVVWGKVILWIDKEEYMQLKAEFYDEDDYLVNTFYGQDVKLLGGKILPAQLVIIPADEEGHQTIITYEDLIFDQPIEDRFFSVQNMKRVR